ncbi:MAG: Fic family protein [Pseudomonadota bacterium]|nr:Fic family protein [Pseudomonadota bacterium]
MGRLLLAKGPNDAKRLSTLYRQAKLRRIYKGIYTDNLQDSIADIALRYWMDIIAYIITDGILSFRTAIELKPIRFKDRAIVFVTSTYSKTITLPGLTIKVIKGNNTDYTEQLLPYIARCNIVRALLENLMPVKGALKTVKTIGAEGVETFLAKELSRSNEKTLNDYRDAAKTIATDLGYTYEYKKLNEIISALLATHPENNILSSRYAKAIVKKEPFDSTRITLFEKLMLYIKKCNFNARHYVYSKTSFKNIAFFESYFSNFIEGTEFIIDEAEDIAFQGKEIYQRHADSHDILANFTLSNDFSEMNLTPRTSAELFEILQNRHAYMMRERPDKRPGYFKEKPNKAGNTYFVAPAEVIGTLTQGFEYYHLLNDGIEKALFMHLLISEVHPFDDGNGRLSRIMMNAELVKAGLYKIIIPTVHRENYLNGLRLASRDHDFRIYCKVLDQAEAYVASINWFNYGEAREKIEHDKANLTDDEGLPEFNRVLRTLSLSTFSSD